MGYPSIKFFSPGTPAGDMGEERASRDKSIPAIKVIKWSGRFDKVSFKCDSPQKDMVVFLKELQVKKEKAGRGWPNLLPAE